MSPAGAPRSLQVRANGLELHLLDWGGDAPVAALALHGFALNCHSFDEVAPALSSRLRLYALDQRGHGLSDRAERVEDYTRENMVGDVLGVVEAMKMFNQIEADAAGTLTAILVENGQPIEFDQPLFVIG